MATKTLTITQDAYERLASFKQNNESFSEVIVKQFPKHSLLELAGLLSHEEANTMRKAIAESRKRSRTRMNHITKRFK
jgi:predicted CopG family antitoxin